eukprot:3600540-Pyramimonas_sp.AAC.1
MGGGLGMLGGCAMPPICCPLVTLWSLPGMSTHFCSSSLGFLVSFSWALDVLRHPTPLWSISLVQGPLVHILHPIQLYPPSWMLRLFSIFSFPIVI